MGDIFSGFIITVSAGFALYTCYRIAKMFWDESHPDKQSPQISPVSKDLLQQRLKGEDSWRPKPPVDDSVGDLSDSVNYAARGLAGRLHLTGRLSAVPMHDIVSTTQNNKTATPPSKKPRGQYKNVSKAEWAKLAKQGLSLSEMSKATGVPRSTIKRKLDRAGIKTKNPPFEARRIDDEVRQNIIDDVAAGTYTPTEAAEKYGVHRATVWKIINSK